MPKFLDALSFVDRCRNDKIILVDSRSEKEFFHAHFPGAINIPLLNDEHRHLVGLTYKQQGKEEAVARGFDLVGPKFSDIIHEVMEKSDGSDIMLYCWRGGMRSNIMAWLLEMAGLKVTLLSGGYKAFRNWALNEIARPRNYIVLGGRTGVGKTELLKELKSVQEQVLDLEDLAHHKGSAFGGLGQQVQPSYEQFENKIALDLYSTDQNKLIWVENESRAIGMVKIPDPLFMQLRLAPLLELHAELTLRRDRILAEYGSFSKADLGKCTERLQRRLGGLRMQQALLALENNKMEEWLNILLEYYDEAYDYGKSLRMPAQTWQINREQNENATDLTEKILNMKKEFICNSPLA